MQHAWSSPDAPQPILPLDQLIPSPAAGWLTSELDCLTLQPLVRVCGCVGCTCLMVRLARVAAGWLTSELDCLALQPLVCVRVSVCVCVYV